MKIVYVNGEMIVTHSSGHVNRYDKAYLEKLRTQQQKLIDEESKIITDLTGRINAVDASRI